MSILSRFAAVGLVAGGFALTGDLGRLADRGLKVLNASDVPAARAPDEVSPPPEPVTATPALTAVPEAAAPMPVAAPAADASPSASRSGPAAPIVRSGDLRPPAGGPDEVSIRSLDAGSRVVIWLAVRRGSGSSAYRCLVLDVVDPAEAEALLYEAVTFTADGRPAAAASAPRRIRLGGEPAAAAIRRGQFATYQSLGTAAVSGRAQAATESIGPIVAIDVLR